jgi:hypothetical protein
MIGDVTNDFYYTSYCVFSILSFICVFSIFKKDYNKGFIIIPIFLECVSIMAIYYNNIAIFGFIGFLGILPLFVNLKK